MKYAKPKSYINQSFAIDDSTKQRFEKLGKNYNSIEFELSDSLTENNIGTKTTPIGKLLVGNQKIELTYSECNKIIATLVDAQLIIKQKQKLGIF
jgi:hypothetical protein